MKLNEIEWMHGMHCCNSKTTCWRGSRWSSLQRRSTARTHLLNSEGIRKLLRASGSQQTAMERRGVLRPLCFKGAEDPGCFIRLYPCSLKSRVAFLDSGSLSLVKLYKYLEQRGYEKNLREWIVALVDADLHVENAMHDFHRAAELQAFLRPMLSQFNYNWASVVLLVVRVLSLLKI